MVSFSQESKNYTNIDISIRLSIYPFAYFFVAPQGNPESLSFRGTSKKEIERIIPGVWWNIRSPPTGRCPKKNLFYYPLPPPPNAISTLCPSKTPMSPSLIPCPTGYRYI